MKKEKRVNRKKKKTGQTGKARKWRSRISVVTFHIIDYTCSLLKKRKLTLLQYPEKSLRRFVSFCNKS